MLADLQKKFISAILTDDMQIIDELSLKHSKIPSYKRFEIYKNNIWLEIKHILQETFPVVRALVGDEFYNQCAKTFFFKNPPFSGDINQYGEGFSNFIRNVDGLKEYPYMGDITWLEWTRHISNLAKRNTPCSLGEFQNLQEEQFLSLKLTLQPHFYLLTSQWPIDKVWIEYQAHSLSDSVIDMSKKQSYLLIFKNSNKDIMVVSCQESLYCFFNNIVQNMPLYKAVEDALKIDPNFDLQKILSFVFYHQLIIGFSF